MKHSAFFYVLFALSFAFLFACSDDDSDTFLVRGDDRSYTDDEDDVSSSSMRSSSSVNSSSSSKRNVALVEPLRQNPDEDCDYGSLIDKRDGQVYKTVVIGEQNVDGGESELCIHRRSF